MALVGRKNVHTRATLTATVCALLPLTSSTHNCCSRLLSSAVNAALQPQLSVAVIHSIL